MKHSSFRQLIAPAAIGLSIVVGTHLYVVRPLKSRLELTLRTIQMPSEDMTQLTRPGVSLGDLQVMQAEADHHYDEVLQAGEIVYNEGLLFKTISDISATTNVSLERLDPQPRTTHFSNSPGTTSLRCSIEVIGSYGAVAMFVHELDHTLGITFVRSLHIVPVQGQRDSLVLANIETEHYALESRSQQPSEGHN